MALYLFVDSGPQQGAYFYLKNKAILGRKKDAEICINSPTISAKHVQVEKNQGHTYLNSLSTKGIFFNNETIEQLKLQPEMCFSIGNVNFSIRNSVEGLCPWKSLILLALNELSKRPYIIEFPPKKLQPFYCRLKLTIIEGQQVGLQWPIGYGPRYVGTNSVDFPIYEPTLGPCGFHLDALKESDTPENHNKSGVVFFTKYRSIVQINGKAIESKILQHDDVIQIASTCLKVHIENIK